MCFWNNWKYKSQVNFFKIINYYSDTSKDGKNALSNKRLELAVKTLRKAMNRAFDKKTGKTNYS